MSDRRCVICAQRLPADLHPLRAVCSDLCDRERARRTKARMYAKRRDAGLSTRGSIAQRRLREPIAVAPFLEWCERRAKTLHALYAEDVDSGTGLQYLMDEIGWDRDSGARRLYRWRNEWGADHMVERADVEDALWRAGVGLWELYDEVDDEVAA